MKRPIILFLAIGLMSGISNLRAESMLRLTCSEVRVLGFQALQSLMSLQSIFVRERELATEAASYTLSATDRGYLNSECQQLTAEAERIINESSFRDSFGEAYNFFARGMLFRTVVHPRISDDEFPMIFEIKQLPISQMGDLAEKKFKIQGLASENFDSLVINKIVVAQPTVSDDKISTVEQENSAIAWNKAINRASEKTGVQSKIDVTVVQFPHTDQTKLPENLGDGAMVINGIEITGATRHNVNGLVSIINNSAAKTGVMARLMANDYKNLELFANDSRNIQLHISPALRAALGTEFKEDNIFMGSIVLRSQNPFEISAGDNGFLGFCGTQQVGLTGKNIDSIVLTDQNSAQASILRIQSVIDDLTLRLASVGMIVDACPP